MDTSPHTLEGLFDQLGLDSWEEAIQRFIDDHGDLDWDIPIAEAPFWTPGQREFLRDAVANDSDWAEIVDQLDNLLRRQR